MAEKKEYATRFGMGLLAVLFLVTSVGFSLLVIWQMREKDKKDRVAKEQITQTEVNKLEGKALANFTPLTNRVIDLQKEDLEVGSGAEVKAGATITAHYTGALTSNGIVFQSSLDNGQPFTSPLSGLIQGWQQGIPGMKVGGTRRLIIPSVLAYGQNAQPGIPADSDLVFDIKLLDVKQ